VTEPARIVVRDLAAADETAWRRLFDAYVDWYGFVVPAAVKEENWRRLMEPGAPLFGIAADWDGEMVGFALCVLHLNTSTTMPVCYLEDLYVALSARRQGVGRALIQELIDRGRGRWFRLYWVTQADNSRARALYDQMGQHKGKIRYDVQLEPFEQGERRGE